MLNTQIQMLYPAINFTIILFIFVVLLVLLLTYFYVILPFMKLSYYKKQGLKTFFFPVIGIIKKMREDFEEKGDFMSGAKLSSKIEPEQKILVTTRGSQVILLLRDTKYLKEFLQNPLHYRKSTFFDILKLVVGEGLLLAEGDKWKLHRKIISSCFNYDFIKKKTELIQETTKEFFDKISEQEMKDYLIMQRIQQITGEVVGRIFFGSNLNSYSFEGKPITLYLANLMVELGLITQSPGNLLFGKKIMGIPIPKHKRLLNQISQFRALCRKVIQDRKLDSSKHDDLLDALLSQQKNQNTIPDEDIVDEFITFFLAGMDTTGHLATLALYYLTQYPQYLDKLKEEREAIYNKVSPIDADSVQSMNVLTCFLKETLRMNTPVAVYFAREALEDHKLIDINVTKGTLVRPDPFAIFYDPKYFDEPEKFKPERWLDPNPKLDPFAFTPFSAGPRNCIGQHLAMQEVKIIVSEFLENFDFKLIEGYKFRMYFRFLYEPYEEVKFMLKKKI